MSNPVLAAGGIIWRSPSPAGEIEVLLVHRPRYDDWSFPKGKLDKGELAGGAPGAAPPVRSLLAAAIREVAEETGLSVVVGHRMPPVGYRTSDGPKKVSYWTMQARSGEFSPNREVDAIRWVCLAQAGELLSYDHDRAMIAELSGRAPGVVRVLLVRHGAAGRRKDFAGPDEFRPLVERGRRQAEHLVPLLRSFGPTRVLSATPLRCLQTVEPIARAIGVTVQTAPMFGEAGYGEDPRAAGQCLAEALAATEGVTVIASQGGVIPSLIGWLSRSEALGDLSPTAAKASAWALASGATGSRADYYPPPDR